MPVLFCVGDPDGLEETMRVTRSRRRMRRTICYSVVSLLTSDMRKECLLAGAFRRHGARGGIAAEVFPSGSPAN